MKRQAALIVNTKSRSGKKLFRAAIQLLQERGVDLVQTHALREPAQLHQAVEAAVRSRIPLVIVGGGDGTLGSIVDCFVGFDSVLGVLPLGTGNQFARDIGVPLDLSGACDVLMTGKVGCVDLGVLNGRYFLSVATVGLTTLIAQELNPEAKRRFGLAVYVPALLHALMRVRPFQATIATEGKSRQFKTLQVVIGNGRYHAGPFPLAPEARITDGRLVVYAITGANRWNLLKFALHLPGGHHVELSEVPVFHTSSGRLVTEPVQWVCMDGEICMQTPIQFLVAAGALPVMVPQGFEG